MVRELFNWSWSATCLSVSSINTGLPRHIQNQKLHRGRYYHAAIFHACYGVSRHPELFPQLRLCEHHRLANIFQLLSGHDT
jgi:hypothetical protein